MTSRSGKEKGLDRGRAPGDIDGEIERLERLLKLMDDHSLAQLEVSSDGGVKLSKYSDAVPAIPVSAVPAAAAATPEAIEPEPDPNLEPFRSPMVGTFYRASSPEQAAFVKEGDRVNPESVLCLIEAMKVFNEIKAEVSGTIEKVLVENGDAVEFGQPLFLVRPG